MNHEKHEIDEFDCQQGIYIMYWVKICRLHHGLWVDPKILVEGPEERKVVCG
jgi:hypothetical protein